MREKWNAWGGWRLVVGIGLAIFLLYLAFRQANWNAMLTVARQGRPDYLALAATLISLSWLVRALRWRILLSAEKKIPLLTVFWGTAAGYLANLTLPARAGELVRSVLLGQKAQISKSYVLATALTERFVDALALVMVCFATLRQLGTPPAWVSAGLDAMLALSLGGLAFLFVAPQLEAPLVRFLTWLPLPVRFRAPVIDLTRRFLMGARAFHHPGRALAFAAVTVVIWLGDGLMATLVAAGFGLKLPLLSALLFLSILGLSSAAPSTPGYLGIYQFVAVTVLVPLGFSREAALTYILAAQALNYVAGFIWGPLGIWQLGGLGPRAGAPQLAPQEE